MRQAARHVMRPVVRQLLWTGVIVATLSVTAACTKGDAPGANRATAVGKITATAAPAAGDTDLATRGKGFPSGYMAQFDHPDSKANDVSYSEKEPGRWEVKTGPAHILYSPRDSARGKYSVTATFEQLEAPAHPEAFGVFIGGSKLDQPDARKYTYFVVRGDGMYLVKVRDGANTRTVTDWTVNPAIPKQNAAGKGLYGIKVDVDGKTAKVSVNGAPVTTISGTNAPLGGTAGVRVNHNLHVIVTPVSIVQ